MTGRPRHDHARRRTRDDRPRRSLAPPAVAVADGCCGVPRATRRGAGRRCSALLAATALLYLWGLGASGWANSFYSAAAQAGSVSWKAFFYGSSDAANCITVDKTPRRCG